MARIDLNDELDRYHRFIRDERAFRPHRLRSAFTAVRWDRTMRWFAIGVGAAVVGVGAFAVLAPELAERAWRAVVDFALWFVRQSRQAR